MGLYFTQSLIIILHHSSNVKEKSFLTLHLELYIANCDSSKLLVIKYIHVFMFQILYFASDCLADQCKDASRL